LFALAYSEPAALVLLLAVLMSARSHRYAFAFIGILLLALTRPVAAPLAVVFAAQWWSWRRHPETRPSGLRQAAAAACALAALLSPWLWTTVAGALAGDEAVRAGSGPLTGSARASSMLRSFAFGWFGDLWRAGGTVPVVLLALVLVIVLVGTLVAAGRFGVAQEVRVWGASYVLFVILVTPVTPGVVRYLLLATPLLVVLAVAPLTRGPVAARAIGFVAVLALGLWSQWLWIRYLYILDPAPALLPWAP
jgi:hypothetical protein